LDLKDALTISLLGIGVVFVGLILTSLLIYSFSISEKISNLKLKRIFKKEISSYNNCA
jgi:Na+-transporting methylmalonyl-CoA/oxaloacetate decarboxylase gamma subunit